MNSPTPFWEKPLNTLDRGEWEALCDGCGRCCVHKLEDDETGILYATNVACKLLDRRNGRCLDYKNRMERVSDCVKLDQRSLGTLDWLPEPALIDCARTASRCRNGIIWSPAAARQCTKLANLRAAGP